MMQYITVNNFNEYLIVHREIENMEKKEDETIVKRRVRLRQDHHDLAWRSYKLRSFN